MTLSLSGGKKLYHTAIVIANLGLSKIPWKEKWQDLKDLVRQWTPNIERAEIYTTDGRSRGFGYVRIKGLEDAKKVKGK